MTMMTDYKATPEQEDAIARAWAFQQQWAQRGDEDSACFLELRSRIERLELGAGIHDAVIKTLKPPTLTDLSPAAQAIWDAWESEWSKDSLCHDQRSIAAVLRAAADYLQQSFPWPHDDEGIGVDWAVGKLQDIATELEAL
jgi:hypothetical protein